MMRLTLSASFTTSAFCSGITVWVPFGELRQRESRLCCRSECLGVKMMGGGLCGFRTIWRRSTWRIWPAVVGCTICMLVSAASCGSAQGGPSCALGLGLVAVRQHQRDLFTRPA
jgi:hypothetical protein